MSDEGDAQARVARDMGRSTAAQTRRRKPEKAPSSFMLEPPLPEGGLGGAVERAGAPAWRGVRPDEDSPVDCPTAVARPCGVSLRSVPTKARAPGLSPARADVSLRSVPIT